jgi:hypothetical protein
VPPAPAPARLTFWQFSLRAITVIVVLVSTAALAYFLLGERYPPIAQLQQPTEKPEQEIAKEERPQTQRQRQAEAQQVPQPKPQTQQQAQFQVPPPKPLPQGPQPRLGMPSDARLIVMITTALIALDQANATGNYTVLYQLGAPSFQQAK